MSPFYGLYDQEYRIPISLATLYFEIENFSQMIQEMHSILECAKRCMQGAQERSKFYADHRRGVKEFEIGQNICLKAMPKWYRLELGRSRRLSPRFCGLF